MIKYGIIMRVNGVRAADFLHRPKAAVGVGVLFPRLHVTYLTHCFALQPNLVTPVANDALETARMREIIATQPVKRKEEPFSRHVSSHCAFAFRSLSVVQSDTLRQPTSSPTLEGTGGKPTLVPSTLEKNHHLQPPLWQTPWPRLTMSKRRTTAT